MTDTTAADYGRLTDDSFERSRARIGVPVRLPNMPHNLEVSRDGLRHFAYGYGDDNPLYCDPAYASSSSWGGPIAPPLYPFAAGVARPVELTDAEKAVMGSGHELDVQAPDAVPNAVPHALPLHGVIAGEHRQCVDRL